MAVTCIMTVLGEPAERLEVRFRELEAAAEQGVVDGLVVATTPAEADRIRHLGRMCPGLDLTVVENPTGGRSTGLNRALAVARCDIVCRVDARSRMTTDAIATMESAVRALRVGCAGAHQIPVPAEGATLAGRGIARALGHSAVLGGAAYRCSDATGYVDTVYLGAFDRQAVVGVGGWDEALDANEDFDLCRRLNDYGARVWLAPVDLAYESRGTLRELWRQYRDFGEAKVVYWRRRNTAPVARQIVALAGAAAVCAGLLVASVRGGRSRSAALGMACSLPVLAECTHPARASLTTRVAAVPAYPVIWTAWVCGILRELAR